MTCGRCNGLVVSERISEMNGASGSLCVNGYRCLLCGDLVDAVILENRQRTADSIGSRGKGLCLPAS